MKNQNWTEREDAVCLLHMKEYEKVVINARHGEKTIKKERFCEEMMGGYKIFRNRTIDGLRQHMDYLLRILKFEIEWEKIRPEYHHLTGLWYDKSEQKGDTYELGDRVLQNT